MECKEGNRLLFAKRGFRKAKIQNTQLEIVTYPQRTPREFRNATTQPHRETSQPIERVLSADLQLALGELDGDAAAVGAADPQLVARSAGAQPCALVSHSHGFPIDVVDRAARLHGLRDRAHVGPVGGMRQLVVHDELEAVGVPDEVPHRAPEPVRLQRALDLVHRAPKETQPEDQVRPVEISHLLLRPYAATPPRWAGSCTRLHDGSKRRGKENRLLPAAICFFVRNQRSEF